MSQFTIYYFIFLSLHSFLMLIDEFYFHHKRGLTKWERIGHPVDTFFVLVCFSIVIFFPFTKIYAILFAVFFTISCLIIVKDEAVHLKYCNKFEQYLHAVIFVLHPILLMNVFFSWSSFSLSHIVFFNTFYSYPLKLAVLFQYISMIFFFIYQIIYWNVLRGKTNEIKECQ